MNKIVSLIDKAIERIENYGYTPLSLKDIYYSSFFPILNHITKNGIIYYDKSLITELEFIYKMQYDKAKISRKRFSLRIRGIRILEEIAETGDFHWKVFGQKQQDGLIEYYSGILSKFQPEVSYCSKKRGDVYIDITKRFFLFLQSNGIETVDKILTTNVQDFMVKISADRPKSMGDIVAVLRKLDNFLQNKNLIKHSFSRVVTVRANDRKIYPYLSIDELALILNNIDRTTPMGKRDYAIILLAVTTGLRSCDIVHLKLKDIDWRRNEINIIQSKTGLPLLLPLNKMAGIAVADYILQGRPKSNVENIFLRSKVPFIALNDGHSIRDMMYQRIKEAGIEHIAGDGKTFHSIRRMLGTNMVENAVPLSTVTQVLGHSGTSCAKQYISLDIEGLRECVLEFSSLKGGVSK